VTPAPFDALIEHRARFLSFVRSRMSDRDAAEDLLQQAFARVVERPDEVPAGHAVPWFYRVLRNAVIDRHRRVAADQRARDGWERDPTRDAQAPPPGRLCGCTRSALASLNERYVRIIEAVDVRGQAVVDVARAEGLTPGNAYVRLHRARRLLGERLRAICRHCADTACVDCHCKGPAAPA
jgi:DNA-directed RNA polymerase specialized sigma24 family protein